MFRKGYQTSTKHLIPALPGTYMLTYVPPEKEGDSSSDYTKDSVIGWAVVVEELKGNPEERGEEYLAPVLVTELYPLGDDFGAILQPDGRVENFSETFPSLEVWLKHAAREHREQAERKRKKAEAAKAAP